MAALLGPLVSVCGNEPPTLPETTVIELVSGNGQTVSAGQTAVTPLAVRVRTAAGAPLPGVVVSWSIATGSGPFRPPARAARTASRPRRTRPARRPGHAS